MLSAIAAPVAELTTHVLQTAGGGFLYWGLMFFVLAVVTGVAGFRGVAGLTMEIAKFLVLIFLVLAAVTLLL
ncbi:MAG: uncharacterized membrane protein YtjA (UPF0391 family) [Natronomonas sp.]|jgi:uncharacterized membrane protein YtjA (UPF0391 family)